ncbi:armadillo-type protein [Dimargaris cristalligena]|uniref:Armadillo-type protein n=1 Tax=Dimargaris cristalligena TaxID=215637 RepID=A0A4P9ZJK3_9FUNG|nr:armadillo-type protein [Dimargaris cristalligena]|eukprot:RKP33394.1 armadillo-type protein [Dimargaris cristalligena]
MGKAKKSFAKARVNPIGVLTSQAAATTTTDRSSQLSLSEQSSSAAKGNSDGLPILKKLESADASDRTWAAASLSNIFMTNPAFRRKMLSLDLVGRLVERLTDDSLEVVCECLGALRNLGTLADPGIDAQMFKKNLHQLPVDLTAKLMWDLSEHIMSLMLSFSESSRTGMTNVNSMDPLPFLMSFLSTPDERIPPACRVLAGQCLYTITDENDGCTRRVRSRSDYIETLCGVLETKPKLLKGMRELPVFAGGVLYHVVTLDSKSHPTTAELVKTLPTTLLGVLADQLPNESEVESIINKAVSQARLINLDVTVLATDKRSKASSAAIQALGELENSVISLQVNLELLANLFTQEQAKTESGSGDSKPVDPSQDNGDGEELAGDSDADMEEDDDLDEEDLDDMDQLAAGDNDGEVDESLSSRIVDLFVKRVLPRALAWLTTTGPYMAALPVEASEVNEETDALAASTLTSFQRALHVVQLRALGCLNNFLLTMAEPQNRAWFASAAQNGGRDLTPSYWTQLFALADDVAQTTPQQERFTSALDYPRFQQEALDTILGCLWSIGRGCDGQVPVNGAQVQSLCQTVLNPVFPAALKVKCVGILGQVARRQPGHIAENRLIGDFLVHQIIDQETQRLANLPSNRSSSYDPTPLEYIFQAIDAIYEIYGDAEFDYDRPVFVEQNYLNILRQRQAQLKRLVKTVDKRTHGPIRKRIEEVYMSYAAFIAYKDEERKRK